jgi:hypothetical protein
MFVIRERFYAHPLNKFTEISDDFAHISLFCNRGNSALLIGYNKN